MANRTRWGRGLKGTSKIGNRWQANIGDGHGGMRYLGLYVTEQEAHEAFLAAAREMHGEFARAS